MRKAEVLVSAGVVSASVLLVASCGGQDSSSASDSGPEPVLILTSMEVAPTAGAEVIATGDVLDGSTLGESPFCVSGSIEDVHGSDDPEEWLIARTITCPDGKVRLDFRPQPVQGMRQKGTWKIVSGTGAFAGLGGSGEVETTYDPDDEAVALERYTGSVTR